MKPSVNQVGGGFIATSACAPSLGTNHGGGEITQQVGQLSEQVQYLHEVISNLSSRIASVTCPSPTATGCGAAVSASTGLGQHLSDVSGQLAGAITRLNDLFASVCL